MKRQRDILTIDFTGDKDLRKHVMEVAAKKNYKAIGPYIKDVLRVHTKFKQKIDV